ncbi:MAG: cyclic nucleotide-binding domain-containing protein [Planctomycetota bacterium]
MIADPTATIDALLATRLFADVDEEQLANVRREADIAKARLEWPEPGAQQGSWPAAIGKRPGFVRFLQVDPGETLLAQGDLTTELFVVLQGRIEAVQARSGRDVFRHRSYGPGDWFGEASTHSHHAALASYRATEATRVAAIEARLLTKLYAEDETFHERVDEAYRTELPLHLRASSLCRDLDEPAVLALQQAAELVTADEGTVIAKAGEPADAVFLVRAGAIACVVAGDAGERTLAFYKGNATFGEHAVATGDPRWPADYKALMRTALVRLPARAFAQLGGNQQGSLLRAANRLIGRDEAEAARTGSATDVGSRGQLDELHVMVERESVKGGRALVIDRQKCVRCNMCVESCVAVHDDHEPRLSKVGTPVATDEVLVTACYHCETPQCMLSCEYAAIRRDPQGRVRFEYDNCVGCAGCIDGCPYGVIRLVEPKPAPPPEPSFFARLPLLGKLFGGGAKAASAPPPPTTEAQRSAGAGGKLTAVAGKTLKCDLCAGLPFEACVYNCPTTAITRREPQSLFDRRRGL